MLINSNNTISFQANMTGKLRKHVGCLANIIHKYNPEQASTLDTYLARITEANQGCKLIVIDNPLPAKPQDIPEQKLFFLVDESYPDTVGSRKYYVPLYRKSRQTSDDHMHIALEDLKALSEEFPVDPGRWQSGDILENYTQEVYERGDRISKASHYRHKNTTALTQMPKKNRITPNTNANHQPVHQLRNPAVSTVIQEFHIKPVVSSYRISKNPLMIPKYENQLLDIIIEKQAEKFNKDLQFICNTYGKRIAVKKTLPKLKELLKDDKLIYLRGKQGFEQIWLASEIGKKGATPVLDSPLYNTIALKELVTNLEQRQAKSLSLTA